MLRGKTFGSDDSDPSSNKGLDTSKWKKKRNEVLDGIKHQLKLNV